MKVPFLSRRDRLTLRVLKLEDGDILLFETDAHLTAEQAHALGEQVRGRIPGHEVLVVSKLTARVIRPLPTCHSFGFRQQNAAS